MGRLFNDFAMILVPSAKKQKRIRFRRINGRWLEFDIPPGKSKFKFGKDEFEYNVTGLPDFEDATGQVLYTFFEGVPFPITSRPQHPQLLEIGREAGNQQIMQINAEERGLQKALLLKKKDEKSTLFLLMILVGINVLVGIVTVFMIMSQNGGLKFF